MRLTIVAVVAGLALCLQVQAGLYTNYVNSAIPDNGRAVSTLSSTITVSGENTTLSGLTVNLNISGGYNGNLYGYLLGPNSSIVLLNRVGVSSVSSGGYGDTGFVVALNDSAAGDVHFYQAGSYTLNGNGQLTGTWQPDGRYILPDYSPSIFDNAARNTFTSQFGGSNPNGTWSLVFSDWAAGNTSTLVGWSLDITVVPEPVTMALGILGVLFAGFGFGRHFYARSRQ